MKKYAVKITSILLSFVFLLSGIFSVNAFAYETGVDIDRFHENCATYYFTQLTGGFGRNTEGTCSYVAAAMLLSYYDSYWNDNIIDETYELQGTMESTSNGKKINMSPGIRREADWTIGNAYSNYNDYINDKNDEFFHLKLIDIGKTNLDFHTLALIGQALDNFGHFRIISEWAHSNTDWSISIPETESLISFYLSSRNISSDKITLSGLYCTEIRDNSKKTDEQIDAEIRAEVINKVSQGIPVIYAGFGQNPVDGSRGGHALVAFDYDEENNSLIFHSGWQNSDRILREDDPDFWFTEDLYALWLNIDTSNYPHEHSYNYNYTNGTLNEPRCMCDLNVHPAHMHNSVGYDSYNTNTHEIICSICETTHSGSHVFNYYLYDDDKHRVSCACGYTLYRPHVVGSQVGAFRRCLQCGHLIGSGGILYNSLSLGSVVYINETGSYIAPNGVIFLSDIDTEMFLLRELDLEKIICNDYCIE